VTETSSTRTHHVDADADDECKPLVDNDTDDDDADIDVDCDSGADGVADDVCVDVVACMSFVGVKVDACFAARATDFRRFAGIGDGAVLSVFSGR
jgi:hypothetical protein